MTKDIATSSIRSVLMHLDGTPASVARLEFARNLALRHEATLCAMFVAAPKHPPLQMALSESPAALLQWVDQAALERTKSRFNDALGECDAKMLWLEHDGADGVAAFCRQALYADLLVLGQHGAARTSSGASAPTGFVESVLVASGKPALILPLAGGHETVGHDVLIGWNATPQAARAVIAALPWLHGARSVHVLEAIDEAAPGGAGDLDIAQYLGFHGITPVRHRHRAAPAEAGRGLLSVAHEVAADLLVMGCYGRGRTRELVLGGASRTVLQEMTLPVLMAHC
jgi:nucleotide-binding universal stress UspA family protein